MESVVSDILSFGTDGNQLRDVSATIRSQIEENNLHITEGLFNLYSEADTIHEVLEQILDADDIESLRKMIIDYQGYVPVAWYRLIPHVRSIDAANLLRLKLRDQRDIDHLDDRRTSIDKSIELKGLVTFQDIIDLYKSNRLSQYEDDPESYRFISDIILEDFKHELRYANQYKEESSKILNMMPINQLRMYVDLLIWARDRAIVQGVPYYDQYLQQASVVLDTRDPSIPPSDPERFKTYLFRAAFNGRIDILDKYANKDNIIGVIVSSFDPSTGRIPPWMYQFLNYKAKEWGQPIDAWVANIIDDYPTRRLPPPDLWRKILATAAGYASRSKSALALARILVRKYSNQLPPDMKQKITTLSNGLIIPQ